MTAVISEGSVIFIPFLKIILICLTELRPKFIVFLQRHIKSIQQFAQLKHDDRRQILRNLLDEEYEDVMKMVGKMPYIDFRVRSEGERQKLCKKFCEAQLVKRAVMSTCTLLCLQ